MHTHTLQDGRTLAYDCYGNPRGTVVVFSHGLSDSRKIKHFDDELTKSLGVWIIAVDQPGVGGSSPCRHFKDRTLLNYAKDIREFLTQSDDQENVRGPLQRNNGKFAVVGHSGGGPHTLAIAAEMPIQVTSIALAAPAPPLTISSMLDLFPIPHATMILRLCKWLSPLLYASFHLWSWWAHRNLVGYVETVAVSDRTSGNPETFLSEPKQTAVFHQNFEQGLVQGAIGIQGMVKVAFVDEEWNFEWRSIDKKISVFASDEDTIITPEMCQLFVDKLPNASLKTWSKAGHYSFVDRSCWKEMLEAVTGKGK